jgi:outer membrane immunogenic protein
VLPKTLIYAKAGYTNARFSRDINTGAGTTGLDKGNYDGWRAGGGIEYAVTPAMYVKAEATVSDYKDGFARRQAVAGFGYRF